MVEPRVFPRRGLAVLVLSAVAAALILVGAARAQSPAVRPGLTSPVTPPRPSAGAALFEQKCYGCHNIGGGDKKCPDLRGVTQRLPRQWFHKFIPRPSAMRDAGDPEAMRVFTEYAPEVMPDQTQFAPQIDEILGLIDDLSRHNTQFVPSGARLARAPAPADLAAGHALFVGQVRLANGGPPCISCHSVTGLGVLGGGSFGPDLMSVNVSPAELPSILNEPSTTTMRRLFADHPLTDEEVVRLFAFLQYARARQPTSPQVGLPYLILGGGGVVIALPLISLVWRRRLRGACTETARSR